MSKFESILSDAEIVDIVSGLAWSSADTLDFGKEVAEHIQQAVLAKLHEQQPTMYARTYNGEIDWDEACVTKENDGALLSGFGYIDDAAALEHGYAIVPLYAHPVPSSQGFLDNSNHIVDTNKMVVPEGWQLVPKEIDPTLLAPFIECPIDELPLAWRTLLMITPNHTGVSNE